MYSRKKIHIYQIMRFIRDFILQSGKLLERMSRQSNSSQGFYPRICLKYTYPLQKDCFQNITFSGYQ
jgi:hypothetical protein